MVALEGLTLIPSGHRFSSPVWLSQHTTQCHRPFCWTLSEFRLAPTFSNCHLILLSPYMQYRSHNLSIIAQTFLLLPTFSQVRFISYWLREKKHNNHELHQESGLCYYICCPMRPSFHVDKHRSCPNRNVDNQTLVLLIIWPSLGLLKCLQTLTWTLRSIQWFSFHS